MMTRPILAFVELAVGGGDTSQSGTAARDYTNGLVGQVPIPEYSGEIGERLVQMCSEIVREAQRNRITDEEAIEFVQPIGTIETSKSLRRAVHDHLEERLAKSVVSLEHVLEIDRMRCACFGLGDRSRDFLREFVGMHPMEYAGSETPSNSRD